MSRQRKAVLPVLPINIDLVVDNPEGAPSDAALEALARLLIDDWEKEQAGEKTQESV